MLTHHTDSTAAVQAAEAKKVYAIGYHSDMSKYGPNAQLTAVTHHWGNYYTKVAQSVVDGKWQQDNVWGGIKDGMIKLAPFNKVVPPDVQELVKKAEAEMAAGQAESVHRTDEGQHGQGAAGGGQDDHGRGLVQDGLLRRGRGRKVAVVQVVVATPFSVTATS